MISDQSDHNNDIGHTGNSLPLSPPHECVMNSENDIESMVVVESSRIGAKKNSLHTAMLRSPYEVHAAT